MTENASGGVSGEDTGRPTAGELHSSGGPTPLAQHYLDQTRPWVRFMSVVTFVCAGLMVLVALVALAASLFGGLAASGVEGRGVLGSVVASGVMAFVYLVMACVYVLPALYLSRYAAAIKRLQTSSTASGLEDALKHQKSFWRFVGIVTVIGIVIAVLVMGLAVVAGVVAFMAARG
jgi:hypothetical protein